MDIDEYMRSTSRLYYEGINSDVHPELLRTLGGALAIAGEFKDEVWVEKNAYIGLIDRTRDYKEARDLAAARWCAFRSEIERKRGSGTPPTKAIEEVMASHGTVPHTPQQLTKMLNLVMGKAGTFSNWYYDIADMRRRFKRGAEVMGDTFGAIGAGAYLIATAKDWKNATAEEWDKALDAGEVTKSAGELAGALGGLKGSHATPVPASGWRPARQVEMRPTIGQPVSVSSGARPTKEQRGLGSPQSRSSRPVPQARSVNRSPATTSGQAGKVVVEEANIAFSETAPYSVSELKSAGLQTHQKGPFAEKKYMSLDSVAARLTRNQMGAADKLVGKKFSPEIRSVWDSAHNNRAGKDVAEIKRLWSTGQQPAAKELARDSYRRYGKRFWRRVQRDPALRQRFTGAGLEFEGGKDTAPFWRLADGTKEILSIDHTERVTDAPWKAIEGAGMQFVPARENSYQLEFIRNNDPSPN